MEALGRDRGLWENHYLCVMYSKEELKQLKKNFWEGFGVYAETMPQLQHRKTKFMLYNTRLKGTALKFDANREGAFVILEIDAKDEDRRLRLYEHFERYKVIMEQDFPDGLVWDPFYVNEVGKSVCRIYAQKTGIDIHRTEHWDEFYRFMAEEMLKMERAFRTVKEAWEE